MTAGSATEPIAHGAAHLVGDSIFVSTITLNNGNSAPILRILGYFVIALLVLFFFRVIRAVWVETRVVGASKGRRQDSREGTAQGPASNGRRDAKASSLYLRSIEPEDQRDRSFELSDELTIGRAAGCGISIDYDTFASNLHARVYRRLEREVWVEDLGSTNGTIVNGKLLSKPVRVRKGDTVQVGGTIFEVVR